MAEEFLVQGKPYYFGGFIRFLHQRDYPAWEGLNTALHANQPITWKAGEEEHRQFSQNSKVMDHSDYSLPSPPHLRATVLELPHVTEQASARIGRETLLDRIEVVGGNFLADPELPGGHDAILLSSVLHDWDPDTGRELLAKCYRALPPGGLVLILELLIDDDRTGPVSAALMSMEMVVHTVGGKNWTETEYHTWLTETGFTDVHTVRFEAAGANGVVIGRKP